MADKLENIYEVKLNNSYEFVTGSSSFYRFLAGRLYDTFDMILEPSCVDKFENEFESGRCEQNFTLQLADVDGVYHEMAACIKGRDEEGNVDVQFIPIENLYRESMVLREEVNNFTTFLSQINCMYYIYDRKQDSVVCFQFQPEMKVTARMPMERWYTGVKKLYPDYNMTMLDSFISDLRNGTRTFQYTFPGEFFNKEGYDRNVAVCGTAVYQNGVHIRTLGNIINQGDGIVQISTRRDQLTGLILKEDITNLAKERIDRLHLPTSIAIIDLDNFKGVNDNFGHMKGDEVLKKCASIIDTEVEGYGKAGRIGGDEFFIVMEHAGDGTENADNETLRSVLRSIRNGVYLAYSDEKDGFHVSTSIGCATYPNDTDNFNDLFTVADYLMYRAKSKGKNRYILYNEMKHGKVANILNQGVDNLGISSRKGLSKSEIICKICDRIWCGEDYSYKNIFDEVVDHFGVERVVLYDLETGNVVFQCGSKLLKKTQIKETADYIYDANLEPYYENGIMVQNDIKRFEKYGGTLYEKMEKQGILSLMHHKVKGADGRDYLVSYESVVIRNTWNTEDMHFFRMLDHIYARCIKLDDGQ